MTVSDQRITPMDEFDDSASNPTADTHLPVGGEVGARDGNTAPDISDDLTTGSDKEGTASV